MWDDAGGPHAGDVPKHEEPKQEVPKHEAELVFPGWMGRVNRGAKPFILSGMEGSVGGRGQRTCPKGDAYKHLLQ